MENIFVTELPYMCNFNGFYLGCIFVLEFNVINLHNNTHYKTFSKIMYNFQQSWLYRSFEEIVIEVLLLTSLPLPVNLYRKGNICWFQASFFFGPAFRSSMFENRQQPFLINFHFPSWQSHFFFFTLKIINFLPFLCIFFLTSHTSE